jgi:hypothetical protein
MAVFDPSRKDLRRRQSGSGEVETNLSKISWIARVMRFTAEELESIAGWEPIAPGFDRDDATLRAHIQPILDRLASNRALAYHVVQDGGMANYFAFIVHETGLSRGPCIGVYLSLMAAVGIIGRTTFSTGPDFFWWNHIGPEHVCDLESCTSTLERSVVEAVRDSSCYELLGRQITDTCLPEGIEIYEYCLCKEPWDRVFHALFSDTD